MWVQTLAEYVVYLAFLYVIGVFLGNMIISTVWGFVVPLLLSIPLIVALLQSFTAGGMSEHMSEKLEDSEEGRKIIENVLEEDMKAQMKAKENLQFYLYHTALFLIGALVAALTPPNSFLVIIGVILLSAFLQTARTSEEEDLELSEMLRTGTTKGPFSRNLGRAAIGFVLLLSFILFLPPFVHFLGGIAYWGVMMVLVLLANNKL